MKHVKIAAVSDLHGELNFKHYNADILTISGDICPVRGSHAPTAQKYWLDNQFLPWCEMLINDGIYKHIVFIPGNHDFVFGKVVTNNTQNPFDLVMPKNIHYLFDSEVTVEGVRIYGTPWTPIFFNWAFMRSEEELDTIFAKIPCGLDILLSHGPAKGYNDTILERNYTEHLGSASLTKHVKRAAPKWLFVGHIHSGNHVSSKILTVNDTVTCCTNVSLLNEDYAVGYPVFTTTIEVE